jgi:hypothetical protein
MNIELTQEQVEAFNRGESITIAPKPKQWEPRGGYHAVLSSGVLIPLSAATAEQRRFGSVRYTQEEAEKARDSMRTHNRLLAYVDEFGGDWVADWSFKPQEKYYIIYDSFNHDWVLVSTYRAISVGAVYMSQECGEGLIAKLESGEVVL